MTIPEAIELLKAAEAGKVIEYETTLDGPEHWVRIFEPKLEVIAKRLASGFDLRVKPEPREWWAGICNGKPFRMYSNRLEAEMYLKDYPPSHCEIVHVREVIDP